MSNKIEKTANSLIKLYSGGNSKSEMKFRKKLENINWDKEQKILKNSLVTTNIALIISFACFFVLVVLWFIGIIWYGQQEISLASAIAIFCSCITTSIAFYISSERFKVFNLLRELLEN
jgi:hypothetical protein